MHDVPTFLTRIPLYPSRRLTMAILSGCVIVSAAGVSHAQTCLMQDCLPPTGSTFTEQAYHHFAGGGLTADLTNLSLHGFSTCGAVPASVPNAFTTTSFTATMDFSLALNGGAPSNYEAPANARIQVTFEYSGGTARFFTTEMLQLDVSAGNMPAGLMLRVSPTLSSTGSAAIRENSPGSFQIDCNFDVLFELSVDGGVTWIPQPYASGPMSNVGPGCPTANRKTSWGALKIIYH